MEIDDDSIVNLVNETTANTPQDEMGRMEVEENLQDRYWKEDIFTDRRHPSHRPATHDHFGGAACERDKR